MDLLAQLGVGHSAVALKRTQDTPINLIQAHSRNAFASFDWFTQGYLNGRQGSQDNSHLFAGRVS